MHSVRELYRIEQLPIFQNRMYETAKEACECPRGDVRLIQDLETGLIYNADFHPELMAYDARYQNEQAVSSQFRQHLDEVVKIVERTMGRIGLVEIGCGKGYFLEVLSEKGFDITGFDPTYEGTNARVKRHYFESGVGITAQGLILRHVLEHVQHPVQFLEQLRMANAGSGLIYIEVPCFDWICEHRAWFDVFYEHVNYFRQIDFERMFDRVIESGRLFGGQYLYVVADLSSLKTPRIDNGDETAFPDDFLRSIDDDQMHEAAAVWGGASKGVIFTLLKSRLGKLIEIVIDINPAKQGKYLPATGIRVCSPAEGLARLPAGAPIYVMNSNYLEEIKQMSNNAYRYVSVDHE
ncbi:MAG: methyltransferase domain-containing protein [Gammaproteobacteria bacterium]|nr:methyltransferase domain-containing protein [Gammaproteobacteria bacterium]MBU1647629.1 methyltransferase domain-containing protein [Gammaproteobacteria bacterium]MBU1971518.1 methyltransferase domain-containing protein [Gammaproteobacteria bacterium]